LGVQPNWIAPTCHQRRNFDRYDNATNESS
jgi:hypothetical protein